MLFGKVVDIKGEESCQSDDNYYDCIFYKMINHPEEKQCKYMLVCSLAAVKTLFCLPYDEIKKQCENFCLSTDQSKCVIYQMIEEMEQVPEGLLPDGSFIEIIES